MFILSVVFIDIDECLFGLLNDCDDNAICTNFIGSYECNCVDGYSGDGKQCNGMIQNTFVCILISRDPQRDVTTAAEKKLSFLSS